jgi:hypothetical protein
MPHKKYGKYFILGTVVVICIGIVSYSATRIWYPYLFSNPSEWIAKWLENPICKVPCWERIIPGETSRDQAKSLLSSNLEVDGVEEREVPPYGLMFFIDIRGDKYKPTNVKLKFDNQNIVQEIDLVTFGGNLYLHNIVSTYGYPKQILFHNKDHEYVAVDLLYPESGMIIELFLRNLNLYGEISQVKIQKRDKVLLVYLGGLDLKYYFDTSGVADPNLLYEWKGYTTYP